MGNKKNHPFVYLNFTDSNNHIHPMQFKKPIKVIIAKKIEEVLPCFKEIQQAMDQGYYAAGYLSYESAPAFDPHLKVNKNHQMPLLWFGIFKEPVRESTDSNRSFHTEDWTSTVAMDTYNENIDKIHHYIHNGITKQVNYTIPFTSAFKGDTLAFYKQLERAQSADYAAYMDIGDFTILSASPELFFRLENGKITTKPMKGTVYRGKTFTEDRENEKWLRSSDKNKYENDIIVDLISEELESIAIPGTVTIPSRYNIEKYPTVYQMTSTVTAEVSPNKTITDIFKSLFPSGSITGLPKRETMEIISSLETTTREVYCGTIGYINPNGDAVFNVPIRTVLINNLNGNAQYGAGGAITINSTKEEEYEEALTKAKLLTANPQPFQLLESMGLMNGRYLVLDDHMQRLKESAFYFDYKVELKKIKSALMEIASKHKKGEWKVRLLLNKNGIFSIEIEKIALLDQPVTVALSKKPISKDDLFLYHKTTNRSIYQFHRSSKMNVFDVLLWNEEKEITEFTMGNIVVEWQGQLVTPPIECGLLAGTYRAMLLQTGKITERIISLDELKRCEDIWFINSVREWIPVQFK